MAKEGYRESYVWCFDHPRPKEIKVIIYDQDVARNIARVVKGCRHKPTGALIEIRTK